MTKVVADKSQQITKEVSVEIEYIYDTIRFGGSEIAGLGTATASNLGDT